MKILTIASQLPYPLIDGGKQAIYYPIKYLAKKGHEIHLACVSEYVDNSIIEEMKKYCFPHVEINSKKWSLLGIVKSLFDKEPYLLTRFHNNTLLKKIFELLENKFDIVVIEGLHVAYYGLMIKKYIDIPVILRLHNIESLIIERYILKRKNLLIKTYAKFENKKLKNYETEKCSLFDRVVLISSEDEKLILKQNPNIKTSVIPAGVEIGDQLKSEIEIEQNSILWMGALNWPPNIDSFWWFYKEIIPLVIKSTPNIKVYVIGSNPPNEILNVNHPNVEILGYVKSVKPYLQKCRICVVPLRIGGGIRLKILEMFSYKKPIVSTSIGCEGLSVNNYEELLIADNAISFSNSIIELISNHQLSNNIAENGYQYVKNNFQWECIIDKFEVLYKSLLR